MRFPNSPWRVWHRVRWVIYHSNYYIYSLYNPTDLSNRLESLSLWSVMILCKKEHIRQLFSTTFLIKINRLHYRFAPMFMWANFSRWLKSMIVSTCWMSKSCITLHMTIFPTFIRIETFLQLLLVWYSNQIEEVTSSGSFVLILFSFIVPFCDF